MHKNVSTETDEFKLAKRGKEHGNNLPAAERRMALLRATSSSST